MNVLVLGGTGFIGYYAVLELIRRGHQVTILALPPLPAEGLFPTGVRIQLADLNALPDTDVLDLLSGQEAVVFAAGSDDRATPKAPARDFFYRHNVTACVRFFTLCRQAGVRRGVLLSSYFAHFARVWSKFELAKHHPYIYSRLEQEEQCLRACGDELALSILELPYIFGAMPGRIPLWKPLIDYLVSPMPLFYTRGGTNAVSVNCVAQAIAGAVEHRQAGACYLVGDENLSWTEMLSRLGKAAGKPKRVILLPNSVVRLGLTAVKLLHRLQKREGGLDPVRLVEIQTRNTFFDPQPARNALGFLGGDLDEAFQATIRACGKTGISID